MLKNSQWKDWSQSFKRLEYSARRLVSKEVSWILFFVADKLGVAAVSDLLNMRRSEPIVFEIE